VLLYVITLIFAYPVTKYRLGFSENYVWNLDETTVGSSLIMNIAQTVGFFLIIDLFTFFKHYSLHTKYLWAFHENHHSFFNPSVLASYATSPFEAVYTFLPALWDMNPFANMYKIYAPS